MVGQGFPFLISCKITHAALRFIERRGEELEPLYERFDWPLSYLRDPSSWLEAEQLEAVLLTLAEIYEPRLRHHLGNLELSDFFEAIGHESPSLRAWGPLDSVLRIVQSERDLFRQPARFLSAFVSPKVELEILKDEDEAVEFKFLGPFQEFVANERFGAVSSYLRGALASLPEYLGRPRAQVEWAKDRVRVEWSDRQVALVALESEELLASDSSGSNGAVSATGHALSPRMLSQIRSNLDNLQRELEEARRKLLEQDNVIQNLRSLTETSATKRVGQVDSQFDPSASEVQAALHELFKLGDYFARAQQLVTLMRNAPNRASAEILIRRTAWETVAAQAPIVIRNATELLQGRRGAVQPALVAELKDPNQPSLDDQKIVRPLFNIDVQP